MLYIIMSFVCFAIGIMADWILHDKDWTIAAIIAYYIIMANSVVFGFLGLIYITFH